MVRMEDGTEKSYSWSDLKHEDASGLSVGAANSYRPRDIPHYQEIFGLDSNLWEKQHVKSKIKKMKEEATFEFEKWLQSNRSAQVTRDIETTGVGIVPTDAPHEANDEACPDDQASSQHPSTCPPLTLPLPPPYPRSFQEVMAKERHEGR